VRWFGAFADVFGVLNAQQQVAAVRLVQLVDPVRPSTDEVLAHVAANGTAAARIAALGGTAESDLVAAMAKAEALGQCRVADVPPSWAGALPEFTCDAFLASFDQLDAEARHTAGLVIGRTDPEVVRRLARELGSDSPGRRCRALCVAAACDMVDALMTPVLAALADPSPSIRVAAAEALAVSRSPQAAKVLRGALADESIHVQLAAEQGLEKILVGHRVDAAANFVGVPDTNR
jgi:hypothetical protein